MIKAKSAIPSIALPLVLLTGCLGPTLRPATEPLANATLRDASGGEHGSAEIGSDGAGLILLVKATGMAPNSSQGAHLHATGLCEAPGFTSAGAHLNPGVRQHGRDNPAGSHLGDLPNLVVSSAGSGMLAVRLPGEPAEMLAQLFDSDGTAVVIHADRDDYRTDPSGNSGARTACGVLVRD